MNDKSKIAKIVERRLREPDTLEKEIRSIAHAFRTLRDSKLRMRIIALLVKDNLPSGDRNLGVKQIETILETSMDLDKLCFEDEDDPRP